MEETFKQMIEFTKKVKEMKEIFESASIKVSLKSSSLDITIEAT